MKKTAGFTLIELVIVIVILGILGAVAAPKFLNLQGDAYSANVNTLKGAINSSVTLGNAKAILAGQDTGSGQDVSIDGITDDVKFEHGYPAATEAGILALLDTEYAVVTDAANTDKPYNVIITTGAGAKLEMFPSARFSAKDTCGVTYTQATADDKATVVAVSECK
ncbi:MAG: prepilin-type N-terminal cleavage/methylation domain-containing protein [Candidatus Oceanisphaera merdipullorum]|nr:prepilin-type N-terminal cleavage/methylation domain-containing protein [Candidatus Oceanisphaera merdipullorum]